MSDNLSTWLNTEMSRRGWSLRQTARRAGVSHTTIVKIANGVGVPEVKTGQAVARALSVPVDEIMRLAGILPPQPVRRPLRIREIGGDDRGELLAAWEQLNPVGRELVLDLAQRLAAIAPRIIGASDPAATET